MPRVCDGSAPQSSKLQDEFRLLARYIYESPTRQRGNNQHCPRGVPDVHTTLRRSRTRFNSWQGHFGSKLLRPRPRRTRLVLQRLSSVCSEHGFKRKLATSANVSSMVEHQTMNLDVVGSTPAPNTTVNRDHRRASVSNGPRRRANNDLPLILLPRFNDNTRTVLCSVQMPSERAAATMNQRCATAIELPRTRRAAKPTQRCSEFRLKRTPHQTVDPCFARLQRLV